MQLSVVFGTHNLDFLSKCPICVYNVTSKCESDSAVEAILTLYMTSITGALSLVYGESFS